MYFVNRDQLERHLLYMDGLLQEMDQHTFDSFMEKLALERIAHMLVESFLDIGNMLIDGFIMRDPGSFEDIIDILADEGVIPETEAGAYKEVVSLRKMLVKEYLEVDHEQIIETFVRHHYAIESFSSRVSSFLASETGVANTFLADDR